MRGGEVGVVVVVRGCKRAKEQAEGEVIVLEDWDTMGSEGSGGDVVKGK